MKAWHTVVILFFARALQVVAGPLTFEELSLLVRMKESDNFITKQLEQRRMVRAVTPQQETTLKAQGASDALMQTLRDPKLQLSNPFARGRLFVQAGTSCQLRGPSN